MALLGGAQLVTHAVLVAPWLQLHMAAGGERRWMAAAQCAALAMHALALVLWAAFSKSPPLLPLVAHAVAQALFTTASNSLLVAAAGRRGAAPTLGLLVALDGCLRDLLGPAAALALLRSAGSGAVEVAAAAAMAAAAPLALALVPRAALPGAEATAQAEEEERDEVEEALQARCCPRLQRLRAAGDG